MSWKQNSFAPKLIYAFTIPSPRHEGYMKVGETTVDSFDDMLLEPNSEGLNKSARRRIDQYTKTAGIEYELLYTENAFVWSDIEGGLVTVHDRNVHNELLFMGSERAEWGHEWFKCSIEELKLAISRAKSKFLSKSKLKPKVESVKPTENTETDEQEVPTEPESPKKTEHMLKMTEDFKNEYDELIKKYGVPDGYGEFSNIIEFYEFMRSIKPKGSKGCAYIADCNILRLDGQPLSTDTVCFVPGSLGRRLSYMSRYIMTAEEFYELGDRYNYDGQRIAHVDSAFSEWRVSITEPEKDSRNYNTTNQKHFNDLQDAIDWRNDKVCETIRYLADLYSEILSEKVYTVLSNFTTEDLRKLTKIKHYTYSSSLHNIIQKVVNSKKESDKAFMYETLGVAM